MNIKITPFKDGYEVNVNGEICYLHKKNDIALVQNFIALIEYMEKHDD